MPGLLYIDVPDKALHPQMTVIAVLLKGPIDLYGDIGHVITSN